MTKSDWLMRVAERGKRLPEEFLGECIAMALSTTSIPGVQEKIDVLEKFGILGRDSV